MSEKQCLCGCGHVLSPDSKKDYKWGHTPGTKKRLPPPSTQLATIEPELEIEAPEEEFVECKLYVSQLDRIYGLLSPQAKAVAVLNGLNEDIT